jgi:hypothetical protein
MPTAKVVAKSCLEGAVCRCSIRPACVYVPLPTVSYATGVSVDPIWERLTAQLGCSFCHRCIFTMCIAYVFEPAMSTYLCTLARTVFVWSAICPSAHFVLPGYPLGPQWRISWCGPHTVTMFCHHMVKELATCRRDQLGAWLLSTPDASSLPEHTHSFGHMALTCISLQALMSLDWTHLSSLHVR